MQKMFFTLMMAIMLSGCATAVPVKIDVETSKALPRDIALSYLKKISLENFYMNVRNKAMCVFSDDGFYLQHLYPNNLIKYEDSSMVLFSRSDNTVYDLRLNPDKGFLSGNFNECVVAYKTDVHEEKPELFLNKIPTALKSLGVKVKSEQ